MPKPPPGKEPTPPSRGREVLIHPDGTEIALDPPPDPNIPIYKPVPPFTTQRYAYWEMSSKGRITGLQPVRPGQTPANYVEIEVDAKGIPVRVEEHIEGQPLPLRRRPVHDATGRIFYSDYVNPGERLQGRNRYWFNDAGWLYQRQETDPKGKVRFRTESDVDERGNFAEERVFDRLNRMTQRRRYTYDAKNKMVREEVLGGKQLDQVEGFHTFAYDERGRLIRRAWHDATGQELSAYGFTLDENGDRVEMVLEAGGARLTSRPDAGSKGGRVIEDSDGKSIAPLDPKGDEIFRGLVDGKLVIRDLVGLSAKDLEGLASVAYTQYESGQLDRARALFESLVSVDPTNAYFMNGVAACALRQKKWQIALNWYDRALVHAPTDVTAFVGKAEAQLGTNDFDGALVTFEALLRSNPPKDDPMVRRAHALLVAISQRTSGETPAIVKPKTGGPKPGR